MGDGGQGKAWSEKLPEILAELEVIGILADEKPLPQNREEYIEFARNYAIEKGMSTPNFETAVTINFQAIADTRRSLASKGCVDDMQAARAIFHLISPNFAKPKGEYKGHAPIEAWDAERLLWLPFSGDDRIKLAVKSALEAMFKNFRWSVVMEPSGKQRLTPEALPCDPRFGSQPFLAGIASACSTMLPPMRPLDDEDATGHLI
jgi:hypothetical protein